MQERKHRFSPQRDLVYRLISDSGAHLSAESIFELARKKIPKISFATVYRNLSQLEEEQKIMKTEGPQKVMVYEVASEPHHHFICEQCHHIENLKNPTAAFCHSCISTSSDVPFVIRTVAMTLYGVCRSCLAARASKNSRGLAILQN